MEKVSQKFKDEIHSDCICESCGCEMIEVKQKRRHYGKENTYFKCDLCGIQYRKRTVNEVARDMGLRE